MIELPEAITLSKQMNTCLHGRVVSRVLPPTKPHKFCWFSGDPADYDEALMGAAVTGAEGFGIFVEIRFGNGKCLCVNDGVNVRFVTDGVRPKDFQLLIVFEDGALLAFTVAMYGGIVLHNGDYDNEYYLKSLDALSPFSPGFAQRFRETLADAKPTMSAKAFLSTQQRFPGIGNGTLQDILFDARIHPKRKIGTLSAEENEKLLESTVSVLQRMADGGGRDTEKDIYGACGGYRTLMCKNSLAQGCPACGGAVTKETYLGGSVYYCPVCQK